jgi:hypothetical protein
MNFLSISKELPKFAAKRSVLLHYATIRYIKDTIYIVYNMLIISGDTIATQFDGNLVRADY